MCVCSDRLAVQDCERHYMNAWLKRCVFNLDLNSENVSIKIAIYFCSFLPAVLVWMYICAVCITDSVYFFGVGATWHLPQRCICTGVVLPKALLELGRQRRLKIWVNLWACTWLWSTAQKAWISNLWAVCTLAWLRYVVNYIHTNT